MLNRHNLEGGFDAAARRYDLMVGLNPGYHRHLRTAARALLDRVNVANPVLLDLGCGSGLSTRALLAEAQARGMRPTVVGVDASEGMLRRARAREWPADVRFIHGRGEELGELDLPAADGVMGCYLLRNVTDVDATLAGVHDALKPGGHVVFEDYSIKGNPGAARRWRLVNRLIVTPLARVLTGDAELYRYLHSSVDDFASMPELAHRLHRAGFNSVESRTVDGWQRDILHLIRATRP